MTAKKIDALGEHLEVEIGQLKSKISDLQTQVSDLKKDVAAIHDKFNSKFSILEKMLKKVLEEQTKILPSEVSEGDDNHEDRKNPKTIRQMGDQLVETRKGEEKIPLLEPISREELGRGYEERHEEDQVPPFPSETSVSIIEEELGKPVDEIFDRFDYEPIAAASLGQVHRASLKGQEVVIKVQRPGLKDLFDIDLKNLRVIAEYLQKIDPKSDGAKRDWVAIYDECATVLYQEIDYTKEAANAELFSSNFKDMDYIKVPNVVWEYTTPQVLTMEYVPGIKINRIKQLDQLGVDRQRLGRYAVESYLEQILSHGFFHADPHPGNIAVDDVNGGRLIFYDFGMMGSISPNIREGLLEAFYGVYEKNPDRVKFPHP
ncbi:putative aarF domain-containing protein kinase [Dendrobium catenatum]|uniref:Putative aarF domain-containing protein kinase n=1 Tax=Dendrobium catenatum TaxID=906689 RepID=A0A2I0W738_9ASPA|nr:putative aarF domain-containing protein kinase [Dendrobium catenatum]